jgi:superfamily II DNA or RNA helicase
MLEAALLPSINTVTLPERHELNAEVHGLHLRQLISPSSKQKVSAAAFRNRGQTCRRVLLTTEEAQQFVIELASFADVYESPVAGVIRARSATIVQGELVLEEPSFRSAVQNPVDFIPAKHAIVDSWHRGIRYRPELLNSDGSLHQYGLRRPQIGALHAIAAHWTLSKEKAMVVMPTGTGKTEVMIACSVAAASNRVLIIVPTDALRQQTADKFLSYGLLSQLGIIENLPNPIVGSLSSAPDSENIEAAKACNVVVSTMSSLGLADEAVQKQFAKLFSHVFFDEAHHSEASTWKQFQAYCDHASILLFTATPYREDGRSLDGKIIYSFPLSAAQEQSYFRPIHFLEVFQPDGKLSHQAIAECAVARLREDLAAGFNHMLMARAATIDQARHLYSTIYSKEYADLNPILVYSNSPGKKAALKSIRAGNHRIIVCVNMFGEGYDLPNLKVAALHSVHKSLGITLQFIGRFARVSAHVGAASFVANTADDGVPEALENLYREDADWNLLLADMSYDAINPREKLSELVSNLKPLTSGESAIELSNISLRPKISAQVYRTNDFLPENYAQAFKKKQIIHQPQISRRDNMLIFVVNQKETLDWTDSKNIATDSWDLYIAYYDPNRRLLYIHSSRKGNATDALAKALATDPSKISGETVFKSFAYLQRVILFSVGLTSRSKNVRYQMFAGLDVGDAIDPVLQQDKMKSNVTGVGYQDGKRRSAGCSRKGKLWSMAAGTLAQWRTWCDELGAKLDDPNVTPNDFLRYTLIPSVIEEMPEGVALTADWPEQLFESANFRFEVHSGGIDYPFHNCQIDLAEWGQNRQSFRFVLCAGENIRTLLELTIASKDGQDSTYEVKLIEGPNIEIETANERVPVAQFFSDNPPLVRLADGSQLSGNILLKPREGLIETFERSWIHTLDWNGVDLTKESRWKKGQLREDSIQQAFIKHLETGPATCIFDDDDTGESADVVAIEETEERVTVYLWHCKYAGGDTPGKRADDLYVVCGQAEKSVKWTWSLVTLIKHLLIRESEHLRGRSTRFIRGSASALVTLRKASRRKFVSFKVGIVQPGILAQSAPVEHLAVLGATNSFIRCITDSPLLVYGSNEPEIAAGGSR